MLNTTYGSYPDHCIHQWSTAALFQQHGLHQKEGTSAYSWQNKDWVECLVHPNEHWCHNIRMVWRPSLNWSRTTFLLLRTKWLSMHCTISSLFWLYRKKHVSVTHYKNTCLHGWQGVDFFMQRSSHSQIGLINIFTDKIHVLPISDRMLIKPLSILRASTSSFKFALTI